MKSHIVGKEQQINSIMQDIGDIVKSKTHNAFRMGSAAISKIALSDYIPDIEKAKNAKERKAGIEALKVFLGKGDNLTESEEN